MSELDIYRGSGIFGKAGDWWSPDIKRAEGYRDNYAYKGLTGKLDKSRVGLENFKKGVLAANKRHIDNHNYLQKKYPNYKPFSFNRPNNKQLSKQFDNDFKKMPIEDFKKKYSEAILPNQPAKLAYLNTLKPFAKYIGGPLGMAYGAYEFLSGKPANAGAQLDNTIDYSTFKNQPKEKNMANFGQLSTYLKSVGNSFLPEGMQTKQYTNEDFNEGVKAKLLEFLQANYANKEPGNYPVTYKDLNNYFKEGNVVSGSGSKFSDVGALKTILGQFNVDVAPDGSFTVNDVYDFNLQDEYGRPMNKQPTFGDVMSRLSPSNIMDKGLGTSLYGAARMYGGMRIPEGSPNAIPITINFPSNQNQQVATAMPTPKPLMQTGNLNTFDDNQIGFGSLGK